MELRDCDIVQIYHQLLTTSSYHQLLLIHQFLPPVIVNYKNNYASVSSVHVTVCVCVYACICMYLYM